MRDEGTREGSTHVCESMTAIVLSRNTQGIRGLTSPQTLIRARRHNQGLLNMQEVRVRYGHKLSSRQVSLP